MRLRVLSLFVLSIGLVLAGCASNSSLDQEMTASGYYSKAHHDVTEGNYHRALNELKELKARFPYSKYAEQAQLEMIYVNYQMSDFATTIAIATQFLRNYPASKETDYVLYLQGLANYRLTESFFGRLFDWNVAARDLSSKRDAFNNFHELVQRFPNSEYAPDARSHMVEVRHLLAKHNIGVARYYARRQAFIAASNRATSVIQHFQGTPQVEEALAISVRCFEELGQSAPAAKSRKLLALNWPNSQYLAADGSVHISWWPEQKTWLDLLTFDLL